MLPLHSSKTQLSGSRRHNLLPNFKLNNNEFNEDSTAQLSKNDLIANQFSLVPNDLILESSLNSIDKPIVTQYRNSVIVETTGSVPQSLLSTIKLFSSLYPGRVSPRSTSACHLVAGKLYDIYDPLKKRFIRRDFLENDYLGLIAREEEAGRTLIAFDQTFVLPGIAQYISEDGTYDAIRTQKLREQIQEMNPVVAPTGDEYIRWESALSNAELSSGQAFSLSSLKIYSFYDSTISDSSELYMIFAPIDIEEAERILVYLNLNIKMYSYFANMAIESLPPERGLDFRYLFPVHLSYIGSFTIISTNQFDGDTLESIYKFDEISFVYSKIDDLRGAFATYLMAEALFYEFPLRWEKGRFYVGMAGHIQSQDVNQRFAGLLTELNQARLSFTPVDNFRAAAELAQTTDIKCFYHHGHYYSVTSDINSQKTPEDLLLPDQSSISLIEMKNPLQAAVDIRMQGKAKQYLSLLGYNINPNPVPYRNKLDLGYRTYQDDDRLFTIYYYTSTNRSDRQIHEIDGPHVEEVRHALESLLRRGYFSTQRFINITRGYPEFIPSDQAINRSLPRKVQSLLIEIDNLVF